MRVYVMTASTKMRLESHFKGAVKYEFCGKPIMEGELCVVRGSGRVHKSYDEKRRY